MSALLEVADLGVALPMGQEQREVVRSVSLQIDAGEALGLVGESGSGKSMTARALLRLLPEGARTRGTRSRSTGARCRRWATPSSRRCARARSRSSTRIRAPT